MFNFLLAAVLMGQCPVITEVNSPPSEIVEYRTGGQPIDNNVSMKIYYGDKLYTVPVVNGYAPELSVSLTNNGSKYTLYDYQKKILATSCKLPAQKTEPIKVIASEKKSPEPVKQASPKLDISPETVAKVKTAISNFLAPVPEVIIKITKAPKIDFEMPADTETMMSALPIPEETSDEEKMISPLPDMTIPQKTKVEVDTRPKAPTMDIVPLEARVDEEAQPPTKVSAPTRVIKPTYGKDL